MPHRYDVFLSHASADKPAVERLAHKLRFWSAVRRCVKPARTARLTSSYRRAKSTNPASPFLGGRIPGS